MAAALPLRLHDLIYIELPGLRGFIVHLADEDETAAQDLLAVAATSIGQKRAARLALADLQAKSLDRAARQRFYARTAELALPFLTSDEPDPILAPFQEAAEDLRAAQTARNHLHRHRSLDRAAKRLSDAQLATAQKRRPDPRARRLQPVLRTWLDVVAEEKAALAHEEAEHPQIPTPFLAGPALLQEETRILFRGRKDLVDVIDHDLTGDRRAPILLVGQRRMGKSSLINMLPIQLGTGTRVVALNFQGLTGSPQRGRPHSWIAAAVAAAHPEASTHPETEAWGETLGWLRDVDTSLKTSDRRLLVALDEIERLEDGIRAGWATTDLLDLLRAAGDVLERIRFLLATAYPLPRLGPHWVDRLINVLPRQLGPLDRESAESLVREPMPGFPDIYPDGGVERILDATRCHPYLVQLVCDQLCRHLNEHGRLVATGDDIESAIDRALIETPLFDELWRQRTEDEKRVLQRLASGHEAGEDERGVVRGLEREGYVVRGEGVAVPMFADWIVETT